MGQALDYGLDGSSSTPGVGGVEIFSSLRVQTDPGVHSEYQGLYSAVKATEHRTSHSTSS